MSEVVVLGGSGTIGSDFVRALNVEGIETAATWYSTRPKNFFPKVAWVKYPKTKSEWEDILFNAHTVFHFANQIWNTQRIIKDPEGPGREEVPKNMEILTHIKKSKVSKLIWISSSIGYDPKLPKNENNFFAGEVKGTFKSLAESVRSFEKDLFNTAQNSQMDIRIFRPTTIIGPPTKPPSLDSHLVIKSIRDLITSGSVTIFRPEIARNYIYTKDLSQILIQELNLKPEAGVVEAYNLRAKENWLLSDIVNHAVGYLGLEKNRISYIDSSSNPTLIDLPAKKIQKRLVIPHTPIQDAVRGIVIAMSQFFRK